jgi:hypothetical protein
MTAKGIPLEGKLKEEVYADIEYKRKYQNLLITFIGEHFGGVVPTRAVLCLEYPWFQCNPMSLLAGKETTLVVMQREGQDYYTFREFGPGAELMKAWKKEYDALGPEPKDFQEIMKPFLIGYGWKAELVNGKEVLVDLWGVDRKKFLAHYELREIDI